MSSNEFNSNQESFRSDIPSPPFPGDFGNRERSDLRRSAPQKYNPYEIPRGNLWGGIRRFFSWCAILSSLAMVLFIVLLFVGGIALLTGFSSNGTDENAPIEKVLTGSAASPKKIAVLPIEGTITEKEDGFVRKAIQAVYEDPRVSGLVLRVNSPGGTIAGSDYYYTLLRKLKERRNIPVYVSMAGIAASGGYYVSMAGDKIFAERSTMTGSIGVIMMMFDASKLCEKIGVSSNYIVSGAHKGMGDMTKPMSDDERRIWQGMINESYEQFLSVIREGRPCFAEKKSEASDSAESSSENESEEKADASDETQTADAGESEGEPAQADLREIADGRIYSAAEAKRLGLIDEIGFLQDAVEAMIENELQVPASDVQVVRYKKSDGLFDKLSAEQDDVSAAAQIHSLIDAVSSPNLYYLPAGTFPVPQN